MSDIAESLELRPLAEEDAEELRRIHREPAVSRWWDEPDPDFPWDEPESPRLTVLVDGAVAGLVQYWEEPEPKYRHAGIDLFLDPAVHGRDVGRTVVWLVASDLVRRLGHHRLVIDPAADNVAAIRCYAAVGFRPVGVMRQYERGPDGSWHDGLLMDLLADELRQP